MIVVFSLVILIQIFFSISVWIDAKSAIHEILATLTIGFAFLEILLLALFSEVKKIRFLVGDKKSQPNK